MVTNSAFRVRGTAVVFSKASASFYILIWSFFFFGRKNYDKILFVAIDFCKDKASYVGLSLSLIPHLSPPLHFPL